MTDDMKTDIKTVLGMCKATGIVSDEVISYIRDAVALTERAKVSRSDYVDALVDRKDRLTNEQLGKFVRNTLWTVMEK